MDICGLGFKIGGGADFSIVSLTGGKQAFETLGVVLLEEVGDDLIDEVEFLLLRDLLLAVETGRECNRGIGVLDGAASNLDVDNGPGDDDNEEEGDDLPTLNVLIGVLVTLKSGVFFQEGVELVIADLVVDEA